MKILFLDIDGVLNHRAAFGDPKYDDVGSDIIEPEMLALLKKITDATGAQIVLSSAWRHFPDAKKMAYEKTGFIDCTPESTTGIRGLEIQQWLDKNPGVEKYAILDDDSDMLPGQPLFQTSFDTGLTDAIAGRVIDFLKNI